MNTCKVSVYGTQFAVGTPAQWKLSQPVVVFTP